MNINPQAKRILCFGDSLTYGRIPGGKRYDCTIRFTGIAQQTLGNDYEIIEGGLRGRMLYGENKFFPYREGNIQFGPTVGTHLPLDLIVIMLGTNDSNSNNTISTEQFYSYLDDYRRQISRWCNSIGSPIPQLLLISPPEVLSTYTGTNFHGAEMKIDIIQKAYQIYSIKNNIPLIQSHKYIKPSQIDGVHLDEENNKILGTVVAQKIKEMI